MLALILLRQIAVMAILVALGLLLCRLGMMGPQTTKELGSILVKAVIPCVIVKSFVSVPYSPDMVRQLLIALGYSFLTYVITLGIAYLIYGTRDRMNFFGASFCNAGFMGVPLVQSVAGDAGVFYLATSMALLNLFQWTFGVSVMIGRKEGVSLKKIFYNPMMISLLIGILLYMLQVPIPRLLMTSLENITAIFTPVAMLLLGSYMAEIDWKDMLDKRPFFCALVRLLLIPMLTVAATMLLPKAYRSVYMAILLASFTPTGVNISIYAQQYDQDYGYSVILVCMSTILSVATVPVLYSIADRLI